MRKPPTAREMSGNSCTICPSFFVFSQYLGLKRMGNVVLVTFCHIQICSTLHFLEMMFWTGCEG